MHLPAAHIRGTRIAFAGRLAAMTRREAYPAVRRLGATPTSNVSRRTALLIVGSRRLPIRPDGRVTRALERAEELRTEGADIAILSETRFLELIGWSDPAADATPKTYPAQQVAELVGITPDRLARWEQAGLVRSSEERYDFQDIVSLQNIAALVRGGARLETISRSLHGLTEVLPEVERPLAQLHIVLASPDEVLAQVGETLIAPDGQQYFAFDDAPDDDADTDRFTPGASVLPGHSAEELFEAALDLEDEDQLDAAAATYRRVMALQPDWADAYFNLGNVLGAAGRHEAAEEMFRLALAHDPDNELAWYNLADALQEQDRPELAVDALRHALQLRPDFADAHFNLASCLTQIGTREDAARHWRAYITLDPDSQWARIARRNLL
ncbi:MAG: tetratricopeptide repeat protein [Phycisphaerales bacterium]|nr:tetratricopeptide repeat protein [Phycisphaerales bacterium]